MRQYTGNTDTYMIPNDNNLSILNLYIFEKAWRHSVRCDAKPSYYNKVPSDHTSSHNSTWILLYDNILAIQTRIWYPMIAIWAYWIISCPHLIAILDSYLLLTALAHPIMPLTLHPTSFATNLQPITLTPTISWWLIATSHLSLAPWWVIDAQQLPPTPGWLIIIT